MNTNTPRTSLIPVQAPERTWHKSGLPYTDTKQNELATLFRTLTWSALSSDLDWSSAMLIRECLDQERVGTILNVATSRQLAPYGFLGLHCRYRNGEALHYILDRGHIAIFLASDFWPLTRAQPANNIIDVMRLPVSESIDFASH